MPSGRPTELTEKEAAYRDNRVRGLLPVQAAIEAGYPKEYAKARAYKIERRLLVQLSIQERKQFVAAEMLRHGVGEKAFALSVKKGLEEGAPGAMKVWMEVFGIQANDQDLWEYSVHLIRRVTTLLEPYIDPNKKQELAEKLGAMMGRGRDSQGNYWNQTDSSRVLGPRVGD